MFRQAAHRPTEKPAGARGLPFAYRPPDQFFGKARGRRRAAAPKPAASRLAEALDVPHSQIRFIQTMTGGAFGGKAVEDANTPIAALLAIKSGKPVRLANNRLEDFLAAPSSMPATVWLRMGLSKDGLIVAKDSMIIGDNGAYTGLAGHVIHVTSMRSDNMHRLENVRARGKLVYTNKIPSGAFRGFGGQQMAFPLNSHLAMLAEMVGMDPLEVQLRNAIKTGETSVHGWHMGSCGLSDCLTQATQGIGWAEKRKAPKNKSPIKRGTGVGAGIHVSANRQLGNWDGSTAIVKMNEDGRVTLITPECDMGQGAATVLSQICAHELNIPISHVTVPQPDTDSTPFGIGTVASRVTIIAGNAVRLAAIKAREQLFEVAAEKLASAPDTLEIHDGMIRVKTDTSRAVSLPDAVRLHLFRVGGQTITPALAAEAADVAVQHITPISDSRGSAEYRADMARVVIRRALLDLFGLTAQ